MKEIGKKIKKEARGGKLKQLLKAIQSAEPTKTKYIVVTVEFYQDSTKLFTLTPFNKGDVIEQIKDLTRSKEIQGEVRFSDAVGDIFVPGKRIKAFKLTDRNSFEQTEKSKWQKNRLTRINKRRKGGFFPHTHVIDNDYVEGVLQQLQIYKTGFLPENPNTCFIESIKDLSLIHI